MPKPLHLNVALQCYWIAKVLVGNNFDFLIKYSFPSWSNVGEAIRNPRHTVDDSSRDCGIELPGNYIDRFTEPKHQLHPHFVRLLPQVRLGMLGNSCGLRVQALASDGRIYAMHIERKINSQINLSTCTAKV